MNNKYYPAFVDLSGRRCVVVGGGRIAERKVISLLRCGAFVTVVSPVLTRYLQKKADEGHIAYVPRDYRKGDLKNAFLVIAATSRARVNARVSQEAPCLVNVVDVPHMANFIVPSTLRRGPLTIAVSTSGTSPAMAGIIRRELELLYPADFGRFLLFLEQVRRRMLRACPDRTTRTRFLKGLATQQTIDTIRIGGLAVAKQDVLDAEPRMRRGRPAARRANG